MVHNTYEENLKYLLSILTGYTGGYYPSNLNVNEINSTTKFMVNRRQDPFRFNGLRGYNFDIDLVATSASELEDMIDDFETKSSNEPASYTHNIPMSENLEDYQYDGTSFSNYKLTSELLSDVDNSANITVSSATYSNHTNAIKLIATGPSFIQWEIGDSLDDLSVAHRDLELYYRQTSSDDNSLIVFCSKPAVYLGVGLTHSAGTAVFNSYTNGSSNNDGTSFTLSYNGWHHIRFNANDSGHCDCYIDGNLKESFTSNVLGTNLTAQQYLRVEPENGDTLYLDGIGVSDDGINDFGNLTGYRYPFYVKFSDKEPMFDANNYRTTLECEARWSI